MTNRQLALALALSALCATAQAGPRCTDAPRESWMGEEAFKAKLGEAGYRIQKFKVTEGRCYEIYGHDRQGARVEVYFHPVSGEIMKRRDS